jgi:hypothetical protein
MNNSVQGDIEASPNQVFNVQDLRQYLEEYYGANNLSSTTGRDLRTILQTKANVLQTIERDFKKSNNSLNLDEVMDEIGSKLFITLRELMESPPYILKHLIENNINISELQQLLIINRNELSTDMNYYRNMTVIHLDQPLQSTYHTRAQIDIDDFKSEEIQKYKQNNSSLSDGDKSMTKYIDQIVKAYTSEAEMKFNRLFIKDLDQYSSKLADKNNASTKLVTIERELNQINNLEGVVGAYEAMIAHIITHIKSIANLNDQLTTLLHKKARITATNEEVVDPLYNSNLSGIYYIIKEKYSNDSFVNLSTHLLNIFTWHLSDEHAQSPELALKDMNEFISIWTRKNLWDKLTFDMFISFALLKGLPMKCPIRYNLIRETNKFIHDQELKSTNFLQLSDNVSTVSSPNQSSSSMPIYDEITKLITRNVDDKKLINLGKPSPVKGPNPTSTTSYNNNHYSNHNRRGNRSYNDQSQRIDTAAAALDNSKRQVIEYFDKKLYNTEILKSHRIYVKINTKNNNSYDVPYHATKNINSICSNCFPSDPSKGTSAPCKPTCYGRQCTRCNYYGHSSQSCLQINDASGNLIK